MPVMRCVLMEVVACFVVPWEAVGGALQELVDVLVCAVEVEVVLVLVMEVVVLRLVEVSFAEFAEARPTEFLRWSR